MEMKNQNCRRSEGSFLSKVIAALFLLLSITMPIVEPIAVMSIDLGSEWIKIAIVKPGVPMEIALNKESRRKTPNSVALKEDERHFSDPAMNVAVKKPASSYLYLPHLLGKKFESPHVELYKSRFPHYNLVKDDVRGTVVFQDSKEKKFSTEELVGMILNNSRQIAENFADHPMKDAVITVPAYYNQAERKALIESARLVGLNVLQLMNDNTAVALNYGIFRASSFNSTERHFLFYDMGATSTTATIVGYSTVKTKDRGYVETVPQLAVKGVGFDPQLGGLEMEFRLRDRLVKEFKAKTKTKKDITENPRAMMKLLKEAARVKKVLSANTDTFAQIENLFEEHDFRTKITREEFETMCQDLFDRVAAPLETALKSAAMRLEHIETVLLMGGGTRVPKVQELLKKAVQRDELGKSINTDEAAALGAVYRAADLTQGFKVKRFLIKDVNLYPIDVSFFRKSASGGKETARVVTRTLFHRLNPIPQKKVMTFNKQEKDFHFNVTYGDTSVYSSETKRLLDLGKLRHVDLSGVISANENNKEAQPKGIKAFFNMDDNGILNIDKVEAHFEKKVAVNEEEEQSTFAKIGNTLSSLFGSSKEEKKDESKDDKKDDKEEKKDAKTEEKSADKSTDKSGEEEKKKDEKAKEKKEDKKSDKKEEKTTENSTNKTADAKESNATATNKTAEKKQPPKPVLVKENITMTVSEIDIPSIPENSFAESVKLLNDLHARDVRKLEKEMAKNSLESFLYEFKDTLFSDTTEQLSTDEERTKINEKFSEISDWLDEDGFDSTPEIYKGKLKELKEVTNEIRFRISEFNNRPKAIKELLGSLNLTEVFQKQLKLMPQSSEIYSEKDIKDLEKVTNEVTEWLNVNWKKQNETSLKEKPVMLVKDIASTQGKLDRELMYLINKAKYYVPKPKPKANKTESANKTSSSNDTKSTGKDESSKIDDSTKDDKETPKKENSDKEASKKETVEKEADQKETAEKEADKKEEKEAGEKDSKKGETEPLKLPGEESKSEEKAESKTQDEKVESSSDKTSDETDRNKHKEL